MATRLQTQGYPQGWRKQTQNSAEELEDLSGNNLQNSQTQNSNSERSQETETTDPDDEDELALIINTQNNEPKTFKEAMNSENAKEWLEAMKSEIQSLKSQNT